MTRYIFGGSVADYVISRGTDDVLLLQPGVTVTFYAQQVGGTAYADLLDLSNTVIGSVVTDAEGQIPQFQGPEDMLEVWADASGGAGPRAKMAGSLGGTVADLVNAVAANTSASGELALAQMPVYRLPDGTWPTRPATGRRVLWVDDLTLSPLPPPIEAPYAIVGDQYEGAA